MLNAPTTHLFDEITVFLGTGPTPQQIVAYRPSEALQTRLTFLLEQNGKGRLSNAEQHELDEFMRWNHFLNVLKGQARLNLKRQAE